MAGNRKGKTKRLTEAELTQRYRWIWQYAKDHRQSPTLREISTGLQISLPATQYLVHKFADLGWIKKTNKTRRGITIIATFEEN